jgi:hypothetical protein
VSVTAGRDWPNVTVSASQAKLSEQVRIDAFESYQRGDNYGVATFMIVNKQRPDTRHDRPGLAVRQRPGAHIPAVF